MSDFDASLREINDITNNLLKEGNVADALTTAMQALQLKKQRFGATALEFQQERVRVASIVLDAARLHQAHGKVREASDLLVFVDNFTTENLNLPSLDRSRLLLRAAMLKELMLARQGQGRHRSALTFGRHFLAVAKRLLLVHELPTAHLNIASVLSAMKQHEDALSHSYLAYQAVNQLLAALSAPQDNPVVAHAAEMERLDKEGDSEGAFEKYELCLELIETEGNPTDEGQVAANPVSFSVEGDQTEQSSLSHLWFSSNHDVVRHPCISLLIEMQSQARRGSKPASSMESERRWRGILALCFRSIAVEQEHLNQVSSALLTYRVAVATANQCLGEQHPVTRQCQAAYNDAQDSSKHRDNNRVRTPGIAAGNRGKSGKFAALPSRATTPGMDNSRSRLSQSSRSSSRAEISRMAAAESRSHRMSLKPMWNPWLNSAQPPPSQTITQDPTAFRNRTANQNLTEPINVLPVVPNSAMRSGSRRPSGDGPPPPPQSISKQRPSAKTSCVVPLAEHELPELMPEDYAFLRQTFKLRHDTMPRGTTYGNGPQSNPHKMQSRTMRAEKRLASALAAELGVESFVV